ncbi:MAG TPA: HEAT repeat domain-containing protein, partial [Planctomycetota bacterium]|nr:HEAT repeat domain-containing protein [Planctomycetota bacterium]
MHGTGIALLASLLLLLGGESVLITKKGEKYEGPISKAGGEYVIQTVTGPRRIPEAEVAIVFENLREVMQRADDRFREAKRLFEEAKAMDEANPVRNQKLALAIEIAQGSVGTYQLLQPHYSGSSSSTIPNAIQLMMQFIRICRGAATSDVSFPAGSGKSGVVALDDATFAFVPPPQAERTWIYSDELGGGLAAAARDLGHPDAPRRLEAVKRLTHPPSPLHLAGLLKLLESEKDPAILQAVSEGLAFMDTGLVLKSLGWAKRETDLGKRTLAFSILRGAGDRAAFEFLMDWFEEAPPTTNPDRAAFASLFRQYHALAVPQMKDLLTKSRSPRVQTETIRQLGVIGDRAAGPMLLKALTSYTKDSAVSLLKLGKPGYPTLLEGGRSPDAETHRVCLYFLRKFSGIQQQNLTHFETWWGMNRKSVMEEEKAWWEEQAKKGWAVEPATFATYELPMESIVP